MITERVPRDLAHEAMILVQVVAIVGKDQIGRELLQGFERFLDPGAFVREKTVAEIQNYDLGVSARLQELLGGLSGLSPALGSRAENNPVEFQLRIFLQQTKDRPTAADFYVIAVCTEAEHLTERSLAAIEIEFKHCGR